MGRVDGSRSSGTANLCSVFIYLTPGQIIPYLHSKSFETRTTASSALSQIFSLVPLWQPNPPPETKPPSDNFSPSSPPEFPTFSVQELVQKGTLLLASSGKEFQKPT